MRVSVRGTPVKVDISHVEKAAQFYGNYLMGEKLAKNVSVLIEFTTFEKGSDAYAYCDYDEYENRHRHFTISMHRRLSRKETLMTLAHEMVHVKQYAKGEMKDLFRPMKMVKWKGEKFVDEKMDYWEQPWEIEAYGREKGLYIKYISSLHDDASEI